MKKNSLTTAVVAGIAGVAGLASVSNAVNLNPDGLGQVLIYPYYTVNAGNSTLLSVVNTTEEVKAVKVRFLEALNSREVLDFNLYLSPYDVWTAGVFSATATGPAILTTADTSCTVPDIDADGEPFRNNFYGAGTQDDDGPNDLSRTRNGHIEIIEMGVVVNNGDIEGTAFPTPENPANLSGVDNNPASGNRRFADWATHTAAGVPLNCGAIVAAWGGGIWDTDSGVDMDEPTGGLFGAGSIVDVANGTNLSYNADAIDGFYTIAGAPGILHTDPGSTQPSLSQARTSTLGDADSIIFDNGALITLDFVTGAPDAVSSVYMHDQIFNEFNTSEGTLAQSEWVVTFPTKRLHIESEFPEERRPFTDNVDDDPEGNAVGNANDDFVFDPNGSCEPIEVFYRDREEGPAAPAPVVDFSPPVEGEVSRLELCYEANVVSWNQEEEVEAGATAVLGATRTARNINLLTDQNEEVTEGWIAMTLGDDDNFLLDNPDALPGTPRNRLFGLPVTGFWAANFVNTNAAPGMLANYSLLSKHRASRDTETVTVSATGVVTSTGFAAS